jgi:hypothetical protein
VNERTTTHTCTARMLRLAPWCLLPALFLLGAAVGATAAGGATAGEPFPVEDCHEVLAFISGVSRQTAQAYAPGYTLINAEQTPTTDDAEVVIRAAECDVTIDGTKQRTRFAEVRITVAEPENGQLAEDTPLVFHWYELSWATNNKALRQWARAGTGTDGVVHYSNQLEYGFQPEPIFSFDAPSPAAWAFTIRAIAPKATGEPGVAVAVGLWRETDVGTVLFRRSADPAQLAVAEGRIETPCGSELAVLLGLATDCAPGTPVPVDSSRVAFLSNTVASETHTKHVFRR